MGAQAVYLQCGEAEFDAGVAPFTTDADLVIDPELVADSPVIAEAMLAAGFSLKIKMNGAVEPGTWLAETEAAGKTVSVPVDLLVPEAMAPSGRGRRDARLPAHGKNATRWTPGLEATIYDNAPMRIDSLEPGDARSTDVRVAGVPSLLVAKSYKLAERVNDGQRGKSARVKPKDAGDIVRLMQSAVPAAAVGARLRELSTLEPGGEAVRIGVGHLTNLFLRFPRQGRKLAVQALAGAVEAPFVEELVTAYLNDLLNAYGSSEAGATGLPYRGGP